MNLEEAFSLDEAIKVADAAFVATQARHLNDVEVLVLRGAWQEQTYEQMAQQTRYSANYLQRDIGALLWKRLAEALGDPEVSKKNFREALKRQWQKLNSLSIANTELPLEILPNKAEAAREAMDKIAPMNPIWHEVPGGQDILDSAFYVERSPIESICYETLLQPGALLRLKAPSLMGKTSLMNRVLAQLALSGYKTVSLSLELAERKLFTNLDKFLRWLCTNISRELGFPSQLDDYWDEEGMGSKVSCTTYVEEYLLAQLNTPLALCLDDVDLVFPYPELYKDFFGLLRSWYEKARSRNIWKKLRLAIIHSTDVYIQLNINQSPFNVGVPIELPEFTSSQVQNLAYQHGLNWGAPQVERLMEMVGGHPYLVQQALLHLKTHGDVTLEQLLETAPTEAGIYNHHLRLHLLTVQQHPELASALKKVVSATTSVQLEPMPAYKLHSMGLVKLCGNQVKPRYHMYSQYFCDRLKDTDETKLSL